MSWLRAIPFLFTLLAFVLQPASASALGPAHPEARVSAFELVALASVGASAETSPGLHEGIGEAYDENASGYRFAARGSAATRAQEVHSVLDPRAARARTTAVTETAEGTRVVSSSQRRLTPAQRAALGPGEVEGVGVGHAEVTGVNAAREMGLTPTGAAASRPICPECATFLEGQGVTPLSPLK
jgi:hypothetical protein